MRDVTSPSESPTWGMTIHPGPGYNTIWSIRPRIDSPIMLWAAMRSHRVWLIVSGKLTCCR
jgi:hypothetical protein